VISEKAFDRSKGLMKNPYRKSRNLLFLQIEKTLPIPASEKQRKHPGMPRIPFQERENTMNILFPKLLLSGFCLLILPCVVVLGTCTVSLAEEPESPAASRPARLININPETGEIDPSATTIPSGFTMKATQPHSAQEEYTTYHEDGSVIVDLNGRFMKPVYGRVDENGKAIISHDQGGEE
jgi:hypothetical protein